eukprot:TRINITY_DN72735_c0_g1_i1.p2 TRINITY_DN72735_c0_g1~~TRINITY_DN72735_c0_g1_i1.p2  ORF type:complete len:183 (-),score=60.17 TRINITY_DN72735_c0_g1_i1:44-592(-)
MSGKGKSSKAAKVIAQTSKSVADKENEGKAALAARQAEVAAKLAKKFNVDTAQGRIGGKGSIRRKPKRTVAKSGVDEKKLFTELRKQRVGDLPGVAECFMFFDDGKIIKWQSPMCAYSQAHVLAIAPNERTGHVQIGTSSDFGHAVKMHDGMGDETPAAGGAAAASADDDVPELVGDFDAAQ